MVETFLHILKKFCAQNFNNIYNINKILYVHNYFACKNKDSCMYHIMTFFKNLQLLKKLKVGIWKIYFTNFQRAEYSAYFEWSFTLTKCIIIMKLVKTYVLCYAQIDFNGIKQGMCITQDFRQIITIS